MRSFTNSLQRQGPGHIGILFIHNANAFMHGTEMLKVYFKQAMDGCGPPSGRVVVHLSNS